MSAWPLSVVSSAETAGDTTYRQRYTISETEQGQDGETAILRRYRYALPIIGLVEWG